MLDQSGCARVMDARQFRGFECGRKTLRFDISDLYRFVEFVSTGIRELFGSYGMLEDNTGIDASVSHGQHVRSDGLLTSNRLKSKTAISVSSLSESVGSSIALPVASNALENALCPSWTKS